jgi:uncharacterized protein (TIGR01741 family)
MEELYPKIANTINEMIPEEWYKVLLYAEIEKYDDMISRKVFFYYYNKKNKNPIYIFDIQKKFDIAEEQYKILENKLVDYIELLWQEFIDQKQEPWTNMMLELYSAGKFNFQYDYTVFDENKANGIQRHMIWRYKNLGIKPPAGYLTNYLKKYLNKEEL